jgi:hypothetical protein
LVGDDGPVVVGARRQGLLNDEVAAGVGVAVGVAVGVMVGVAVGAGVSVAVGLGVCVIVGDGGGGVNVGASI